MNIKNNLRVRDVIYGILILSAFIYTQWLTNKYTHILSNFEKRESKQTELIVQQAQESFLTGCQTQAQKSCGNNQDLCIQIFEACRVDSALYQFKLLEHYNK